MSPIVCLFVVQICERGFWVGCFSIIFRRQLFDFSLLSFFNEVKGETGRQKDREIEKHSGTGRQRDRETEWDKETARDIPSGQKQFKKD